jgi:hypothetical protein
LDLRKAEADSKDNKDKASKDRKAKEHLLQVINQEKNHNALDNQDKNLDLDNQDHQDAKARKAANRAQAAAAREIVATLVALPAKTRIWVEAVQDSLVNQDSLVLLTAVEARVPRVEVKVPETAKRKHFSREGRLRAVAFLFLIYDQVIIGRN